MSKKNKIINYSPPFIIFIYLFLLWFCANNLHSSIIDTEDGFFYYAANDVLLIIYGIAAAVNICIILVIYKCKSLILMILFFAEVMGIIICSLSLHDLIMLDINKTLPLLSYKFVYWHYSILTINITICLFCLYKTANKYRRRDS